MIDWSREAGEPKSIQIQAEMALLHHFSIATALVFIGFGSVYLVTGVNLRLGLFEVMLGFAQVANLLYLRRTANTGFSSRFLVISVYFMSVLIFITGGLGDTGYLWILFIPLFTMLLLKSREAVRWLATYTAVIGTLSALYFSGPMLHLPYSVAELRQTLIVYVLIIYLTYLNEKLKALARGLLVKQNGLLNHLTRTDPLTGLSNRGHMTELMEKAFKDFRQSGRKFSVVMIDLDHFKEVNDSLGHQAGDQVLKRASELFSNSVDEGCYVGRWGGEEFMILCQDLSLEGAAKAAERLCEKVSMFDFDVDRRITASFGVVSSDQEPASLEAVLMEADRLLYEAKDQGRNRVICYA